MATMRSWLAKLLFFLRITDEQGVLSLTHGFVVLTGVMYALHPDAVTAGTVAAAVANYAVAKKGLPWLRAVRQAGHDVEVKKVEVAADVKTTQEQVAKLASAVRELATPERMAKIAEINAGGQPRTPRPPTINRL